MKILNDYRNFQAEAKFFRRTYHPNIIEFHRIIETQDGLGFVMEWATLGTLSQYSKKLSPKQIVIVSFGIATGLQYLHSLKLIHRDIKPSNVLLVGDTLSDFTAKISDFGLLKQQESLMTQLSGTLQYMAPEVVKSHDYTYSVDIYSFSVILYELYSGKDFLDTCETNCKLSCFSLVNEIANKRKPVVPMSCPEHVRILISKGWDLQPKLRPTAEEFAMAFSRNFDSKFLLEHLRHKYGILQRPDDQKTRSSPSPHQLRFQSNETDLPRISEQKRSSKIEKKEVGSKGNRTRDL